ncbi:YciI-like protein [Pseudidiomarina aestuarii]|uniref:YciI-like protein n=1 Tax=Pseudidiomarina aestuarii TaxID=624146 RepID=UPI003A9819AD
MHYVLIYQVADDYLERRGLFREKHLKLAWNYAERGELILGGAVGEPIDRAHLVFNVDSKAAVEAFVQADPYVQNGLIKSHQIMPWHTVVGDLAANPTR